MTIRTTETTVTFRRPFRLADFEGELPAGTYRVVTDEEEIVGLSFLAYRRTATMLHAPAISVVSGIHQVFMTSPAELVSTLDEDARP